MAIELTQAQKTKLAAEENKSEAQKKQEAEDAKAIEQRNKDNAAELAAEPEVFGSVKVVLSGAFAAGTDNAALFPPDLDKDGKAISYDGKTFTKEFVHSSKTSLDEALLALQNYASTLRVVIGAAATRLSEDRAKVAAEEARVARVAEIKKDDKTAAKTTPAATGENVSR